jgi:pimeloyl-ACP methyl ester carboxylesterase
MMTAARRDSGEEWPQVDASPVVLVHGAWTGGWAWGFVRARLAERGVWSAAVDLPSAGPAPSALADDVATVRGVLDLLDGPVVLVGHGSAGVAITEASAGHPAVGHLVYVCASMPAEGESAMSLMASDPVPTRLLESLRATDDGLSRLERAGARDLFFDDVPPERSGSMLAALGTHRLSVFAEPVTAAGWREHPSTYVVTTEDRILSPDLQRRMSRHASRVLELRSGHFPLLSCAGELAHAIAVAARSVARAGPAPAG